MEKVCRKYEQKADSDPCLILVNSPKQPMHARNSIQNKIFWKRINKKPFKKLTWLFPLYPAALYWPDYEKQVGPGFSYQSLWVAKHL